MWWPWVLRESTDAVVKPLLIVSDKLWANGCGSLEMEESKYYFCLQEGAVRVSGELQAGQSHWSLKDDRATNPRNHFQVHEGQELVCRSWYGTCSSHGTFSNEITSLWDERRAVDVAFLDTISPLTFSQTRWLNMNNEVN